MIILKLLSLFFISVLFAGLFFVFTVVHNIRTLLNLRKRTSTNSHSSSQQSTYSGNQQSSYAGSQQSSYTGSQQSSYSTNSHRGGETVYNTSSQRKRKIIPQDEGEYVDFEEIK